MEYEIVEPIDCGSWQEECDRRARLMSWKAIAADDIYVQAMEIPESEEA